MIDRVRTFNADETHLIDVAEFVVFGSYLDPDVQRLGDLDIGVTFCSRIPDTTQPAERTEILLSYAEASGRRFGTLLAAGSRRSANKMGDGGRSGESGGECTRRNRRVLSVVR